MLAAGDANGNVYLRNTANDKIITIFHDLAGQIVNGVVFSPDGRALAVGDV